MQELVYLGTRNAHDNDHLVDLFCGGGGSGGGILDASKRLNKVIRGTFVNHWDKAIEIHQSNHPEHRHLREDLFLLDPKSVFAAGTNCSLLFASPQCTHFSVARGAACVSEQGRSHAYVVIDWVRHLKPDMVMCENVKEFLTFGPVEHARDKNGELRWAVKSRPAKELPDAHKRKPREREDAWSKRMESAGYVPYIMPIKAKAGEYFKAWADDLESEGYHIEHRIMCSADYGDPTSRRRLILQAVRRDSGKAIVWPNPTHAKPNDDGSIPDGKRAWVTAREIIDWTKLGKSIFNRKRPLAANTMRRMVIGLVKFGLKDFLVEVGHGNVGPSCDERRAMTLDAPLGTQTARGNKGLASPDIDFIVPHHAGTEKSPNVRSADSPVSTITTTMSGERLCRGHVVPMLDHVRGQGYASGVEQPVRAISAGGQHTALINAFMFALDQTGGSRGNHGTYSIDAPVKTLVTKANTVCVDVRTEGVTLDVNALSDRYVIEAEKAGQDAADARSFITMLVDELRRKAGIEAKPWVYVYYTSGSVGQDIDAPLPTIRTKEGSALCYPVLEVDGQFIRIDLLYRMLSVKELQRAMGFPDDMDWAGATQEECVKAIGNSVSHNLAKSLALAYWTQNPDITKYL